MGCLLLTLGLVLIYGAGQLDQTAVQIVGLVVLAAGFMYDDGKHD